MKQRRLYGTQKYTDRFNCGHPRTPENSNAKVRPQCKQCDKAKDRTDRQRFKCGHPCTPDNSIAHQGPVRLVRRCKQCSVIPEPQETRLSTIRLYQPPLPRAVSVSRFCDVQAGRSYSLAVQHDRRTA